MTPEEFRALLNIHGCDLTRWPHDRRQAATRLLETSEEAKGAFAEARRLDDWLTIKEPPLGGEARTALVDSIMDRLDETTPEAPPKRERRSLADPPATWSPGLRRQPDGADWHGVTGWGPATPNGPETASLGGLLQARAGLWLACLALGLAGGYGLGMGWTVGSHDAAGLGLLLTGAWGGW
ncbi:hypothetical protein [Roseospirillum parvum]|uniref:Uncharacterized protein n=1 Tax=Roseospirillum parvum TaxID=83401 RepID=A0A1G8AMZ2_9PROT|nr:hypothetical protein [Roseospirillum parvum]SDH22287.1 hypothetical protein SAMN05421742_10549 [Roseospirillum parvum]